MEEIDSVTILLTGRNVRYAERIRSLLEDNGLLFEEYGFKPIDRIISTKDFKREFLIDLIKKYNSNHLEIWEDRIKHQEDFETFLKENNLMGKVHRLVPTETQLSLEHEMEIVNHLVQKYRPNWQMVQTVLFVGAFLDSESRDTLIRLFPAPSEWSQHAHHVVIKPAAIHWETERQFGSLGDEIKFKAISFGKNDKAMAVRVDTVKSANKIPHVTLARFLFGGFDG